MQLQHRTAPSAGAASGSLSERPRGGGRGGGGHPAARRGSRASLKEEEEEIEEEEEEEEEEGCEENKKGTKKNGFLEAFGRRSVGHLVLPSAAEIVLNSR